MKFSLRWLVFLIMASPQALRAGGQFNFRVVKAETLRERLQSYKGNDSQREAALKGLFEASGCTGDQLTEQLVKGLKQPNLLCVLRGETDSIILVGAHYDHVDAGDGVVDNWSGASMLPSLYQALNADSRRYTWVFAAFAGEEKGLVGSSFYVKQLAPEQLKKIRAMICMDTLALGPTEVWVSRSDKELVQRMAAIASALKLPVIRVDVDGVGASDEEPFRNRRIPTITLHSLTQSTLKILHSPRDTYQAVKFDDYYDSYRLISGYLHFLDMTLSRPDASK